MYPGVNTILIAHRCHKSHRAKPEECRVTKSAFLTKPYFRFPNGDRIELVRCFFFSPPQSLNDHFVPPEHARFTLDHPNASTPERRNHYTNTLRRSSPSGTLFRLCWWSCRGWTSRQLCAVDEKYLIGSSCHHGPSHGRHLPTDFQGYCASYAIASLVRLESEHCRIFLSFETP